ncbi:PREDICTED: copper transporter 6-like [Ipomoea nil]|uniref:copper transporter 6-like n=1 Tax=Ipomoea nil TaxID=35883 RepID=UPI000900E47D|nr:PREDICTED: copper transporter 6-like [Ipomoea nil]
MGMSGMKHTGGHMHGMGFPPSPSAASNGTAAHHHRHTMMHMAFFWGRNTVVLFSGWPGYDNLGMYVFSLVVVFALAVLVEWLSNCNYIKDGANRAAAGILQTAMYGLRIGLANMLMLAVMSFNGGIFLMAVAGHALGFYFFGSRAFNKPPSPADGTTTDLPPMHCGS